MATRTRNKMTAQLFERDEETSTILIAERRFPAVILICPPVEDEEDDEYDRSLGSATGDNTVYVPAENGVLFEIEPIDVEAPSRGLILTLSARTCYISHDPSDPERFMYLPHLVSLNRGKIASGEDGVHVWRNAEPEWVVETIDRLSQAPYTEPEGPLVQMVRLDYFAETPQAETA